MLYKSTRNDELRVSAAQAIAQGISTEGGLFVPETVPFIGDMLEELAKLDYMGRAKKILGLYLSDYSEEEIADCVEAAYAKEKFENTEPIQLAKLSDKEYVLELWHGPTCAFKDMALQILPHLLTKALKKKYDGKEAVILVATSGDTGKAALEGFKNVDGTRIIVFYPHGGVSPMQLRQMNTQEGDNVCVCAVEGNFDDCQTQVKRIFTSEETKNKLAENNMIFSSANSINWGRLLPQIVYYISAYLDLVNSGEIEKIGDSINVVVPTGNFGNILAAYYAKEMGLPINKFICASNANNVLTDFINSGTYDKDREFFTTTSPSMDILVSSNLERLLYHLSGENAEALRNWMTALSETGSYTVDAATADKVRALFYGGCCDDAQTAAEIAKVYAEEKYLSDTHTAVALKVYDDYVAATGDMTKTVIASTASPYKFGKSVLTAIGEICPDDEFETADKLSLVTDTSVPEPITALKEKTKRFENLTNKDTIVNFVLNTLGI